MVRGYCELDLGWDWEKYWCYFGRLNFGLNWYVFLVYLNHQGSQMMVGDSYFEVSKEL